MSARKIFILLAGLCPILVFSQQYNIKTFSTEKGLPKSAIYCITQDTRGYLWLGTDGGGACRFDGKNFVSYTRKNGLVGDVVRTILEDSKGNIWFGTDSGITVYNGYKFITINRKRGLPDNPVLKIVEDSKQNIWVGTSGGGLCKIKLLSNDKVLINTYTKEDNKLQTNYIFDIYEDKNHRLWLGLYGGINILTFNNNNIMQVIKLDYDYGDIPSNFILSIEADLKGDLWFGTQDAGAFKITMSGNDSGKVSVFNTRNGLHDNTVWSILSDSKGNLWFGTDTGGVTTMSNGIFITITKDNGLPGNQVVNVFEDIEGNIWIGTFGNGLCQYLGDNFIQYTEKDGLPNKNVTSIIQDYAGEYWVATDGGGLAHFYFKKNKPIFKNYTQRNGLGDNYVKSVSLTKDGKIWIASRTGISVFDHDKIKHYSDKDCNLFKNRVNCVLADSKGIVWCGTSDGMVRYDGKSFFPIYEEDDKYALFNSVQCIIEDKKGNIWYGTYGGLLKNDGLLFTYYDEAEGLLQKKINCLAEDKFGNIWIGTFEGGLYKFNVHAKPKEQPISMAIDNNLLSSNNIYSLVFQDKNTLIVGTDNGFDKIIFDETLTRTIAITNYNQSDGFKGVENLNASICKDNNGNIWFGTINGLIRYSPASDKINLLSPITNITGMNLFFAPIDWQKKTNSVKPWFGLPDKLVLSYSDNHLTFKFSGISLTNPDKVQYKYMLEGLDKDWTPARKEGEAVYPGLPPGEYIFKVIAKNKVGKWNDMPVSLPFTIKPPFWKTTWFFVCSGLFLLLCFYLFMVIRLRKLRRDKRILEEKVRLRTAEIEKQKHEIEEKNREITDSIRYARRIQSAIMPTEETINNTLSDYFILYKPKDIVSGDFYWVWKKNNLVFVAAADCTGHGVPGAFMSMLGISFLTDIVGEEGIKSTGQILDELRTYIINSLQQKGKVGEQKDGMDIALFMIDTDTNILYFSGANNPLYIIPRDIPDTNEKRNFGDNAIQFTSPKGGYGIEIKADKMPIAIYEKMPPFSISAIKLLEGDMLYIFSDGYEDQFGGPNKKKFKSAQFKELLLGIRNQPMSKQKEIINTVFENWKGDMEQIDDVLVIGVQFWSTYK